MYGVWRAELIRGNSMTHPKGRPWCAHLLGLDPNYGFRRDFLYGMPDYTYGEEHHTRGVYLYFHLPPGLYETHRAISWKHCERAFWRVDEDGQLHSIEREEVIACLRNDSLASVS